MFGHALYRHDHGMGRSAWDVTTERVVWLDDGAAGLPGGLAGERYVCQACGEHLILKGIKPGAKVEAHFSHQSGAGCSAPEREAQIDAMTEVVITFRDTICAVPGVTATIELPGEEPGSPTGLGPVIIACFGETKVAIERPPARLPGPDVLRRRIEAVRERHPGAAHVWFLKKDRAQFGKVGTVDVWLDNKDGVHDTVAPTEQQEAIVAAGGHVYWLDGQLVLIPYGVHWFRHPSRHRQDWTGWARWRSDPREDWRISQPKPAPDADCWGLAPVALSSLTRTRAVFQPATAHRIMADLYAAQDKRYGWRNRKAYAVFRERHQQPLLPAPAVPATYVPRADVPAPLGGPAAGPVPGRPADEPGASADARSGRAAGAGSGAPSPAPVPAEQPLVPPRSGQPPAAPGPARDRAAQARGVVPPRPARPPAPVQATPGVSEQPAAPPKRRGLRRFFSWRS